MTKKLLLTGLLSLTLLYSIAQAPKGISMEDYQKAKSFVISDLDNDTYVKFENAYILDRYEGKKPYFITGDDGNKKRIDLYSMYSKGDENALGTLIYYTTEKGKLYTALLPNNFTEGKVWEKYFEDIHAIDKEEPNFVLKLSYVLSREYSYQGYKATLKGNEIDRSEAGTYGNDICFPGHELVALANGKTKTLSEVQAGDEVVTVDPVTHQSKTVKVMGLVEHEAKNYAITHLTLIATKETQSKNGTHVLMQVQEIEATPNHPVTTNNGIKNIGSVNEGDKVICIDKITEEYKTYTVWKKEEKANGVQKVYNIEAEGGSTFIINGVMVMQKQQANN